MKTFEYTIKDQLGIHARPAGLLVKTAKACYINIFRSYSLIFLKFYIRSVYHELERQ